MTPSRVRSKAGRRLATAAAALVGVGGALTPPGAAGAQESAAAATTAAPSPPRGDTACTYRRCALGIAPAWSGLNVVRGADGARVAGLGFFWARGLAPVFAGADSASHYASRAVRVRRGGALLTDAGLLLLGYAAARQIGNGRLRRGDRNAAVGGAAALAASVPLQFAADGLLSRAVWWYNARFGR